MERIKNSNTQYQETSEVLISLREPYNKNTLWIHPNNEEFEIKIYNKGWKVLMSTKDLGLSTISKEQVEKLVKSSKLEVIELIKKHLGKYSSNSTFVLERQKQLEEQIKELNNKLDKLSKKYSAVLSKINSH